MAVNESIATEFLQDVFLSHTFAGNAYIMPIAFLLITLVLLTRKPESWMTLALPITIGWHFAGITMPILVFSVTSIMFVISALSQRGFGGAWGTAQSVIKRSKQGVKGIKWSKKYLTKEGRLMAKSDKILADLERKNKLDTRIKNAYGINKKDKWYRPINEIESDEMNKLAKEKLKEKLRDQNDLTSDELNRLASTIGNKFAKRNFVNSNQNDLIEQFIRAIPSKYKFSDRERQKRDMRAIKLQQQGGRKWSFKVKDFKSRIKGDET